jgi:hypothetical protein
MADHDDELPETLQHAVRALREPVDPPSDIWRHRLLKAVETVPAPAPGARRSRFAATRWSFHPLQAIAAGLVCVVIGGAAAWLLVPRAPVRPSVAAGGLVAPSLSRVRFTLVAPGAATVTIVGDFNGWNPAALPLRRAADGQTWEVEVPLSPGRYAYAFVVDGALARDPSAPQTRDDDFGSPNSIVMVSEGGS